MPRQHKSGTQADADISLGVFGVAVFSEHVIAIFVLHHLVQTEIVFLSNPLDLASAAFRMRMDTQLLICFW